MKPSRTLGDDAGILRHHAEPARAAKGRPELENHGLGAHIPQETQKG